MTTSTILFAAFRLEGVSWRWSWLWLLLILAGAAFLVWTYSGIFQRSGRHTTWWLMGLRAAGLLLVVLMLARPTWTREREEVEPGRVAIILDTSKSMSLPADSSGVSRYQRAKEAVESLRKKLTAKSGEARLVVDVFDITGAPIKEIPKEPTGDFTDITRALRQTMTRLRARPLAGVVLISDGVDNTGRPGFQDWEDTGVAIHTIGFPRSVDFDLGVREPQAQRRVIVHNDTTVAVPVVKRGQNATEATVTLKRGREVLVTKKVKLPAGDVEQLVSLTYKPEEPGSFELTAAVEGQAGEQDTSNNAVNFPMEVVKDPIRVLYIEGFLRNEYTFLVRHFAEKDPDVTLIPAPRRTSPDGPDKQLPEGILTPKVLDKIDVVILGDMPGNYLSGAQYQALRKWLDGKNHSLLVLGGYLSFGPDGFRETSLAQDLPVVFAGAGEQSEKPFLLKLTDKGQAHPIFTVSSDRVRSNKLWQEAPPLDGMPVVARAKPGADVLAVNPEIQVAGEPAVALAVQRAGGGGQVMVFCPDTTWNWTRLPRILGHDDTLYSRFWSQTIRWLAGRSLDDSRPVISVRTGKPIYEANKKVTIRIVRQRRPGSDLTGAQVSVDVTDPKGQPVNGLEPRSDSADPDVSTVEFNPTVAGRYDISAALKSGGKVLANQKGELRVRGADLELADAGTRPDNLRALAGATGGEYSNIEEADEVAGRITRIERRKIEVKKSEYWDSKWLFGAFLAAITGEWFLRRRNHLV
jgi:uncharacterized membrane protein